MVHPEKKTTHLMHSRTIRFPASIAKCTKLLAGPPETASMKSGYVVLKPGQLVGYHTTGSNEELLVPLSGSGELLVTGQESLNISPGCVLYNPPHTEHDVRNTGSEPLIYIYVVSKAD
jgi:mannose-6-phosphate isomerase-like protein (cupin superfamily)